MPTTRARWVLPSEVRTVTVEAPETTWLLVTISPSEVRITPEPVDLPESELAEISTMDGDTAWATWATVPLLLADTFVPLTAPVAAVAPSAVHRSTRVAVPPPTAAAAIATAARRPTPRRALRCAAGAGAGPGAGGGTWPPDGQIVVPGPVVTGCVGSYGGRGG
ncbi:hypothetical protein GCM10017752_32250 [Streptomyces roseoviridis]